jgi:hypothetical protein
MIAICGIKCNECPAFLATQENDDLKRKEVAEMWSKEFQAAFKPEDINCDGCTTGRTAVQPLSGLCNKEMRPGKTTQKLRLLR